MIETLNARFKDPKHMLESSKVTTNIQTNIIVFFENCSTMDSELDCCLLSKSVIGKDKSPSQYCR